MRRLLASTLLLTILPLVGCGNSRTPVPSADQPLSPDHARTVMLPAYGITFRMPHNWSLGSPRPPLVATVSSGAAVVAVWSYQRIAPPPRGSSDLAADKARLVAAARRRDPNLELIRANVISVDNHPAIELDAFERISGQRRRVRSVHVFGIGQEVVLDAYAPPNLFHPVDHAVFSPLKRSLQIAAPAGA